MGYVFLFICFLKVPIGESEKKRFAGNFFPLQNIRNIVDN